MSATGNETTLKVSHQVLRGMSSISSRAALARLSEETYPSRRGTPLMQEPPPPPEAEWEDEDWEDEDEWEDDDWEEDYWEDDDWEDDDWEEPWEEPEFENVTIASVTWAGNDDWERAIYKLSNGYSAFASKGLGVGQTPFDYEELRAQGGGYYNAPAGTVGHVFTRNGGALIIKEGSTFKQQQYGWGNQGPVFAASKQDVTSQIGKIEEMSNSDIDGDGEIGVVEPDELEVEVDSALYDNPEGDMSDRAIYRMSDGSVFFAEQGLEKGDVPMEGDKLSAKKGDVKVDGLAGAYWSRNGIAIVYSNNGVVTQQGYKWANNGLRESGKLRVIKNAKQVIQLEERLSEDLNDDGAIGEGDEAEIEVRSVIYENQNGDFEQSIYKMSDDSVYFAEPGLEKGDLPMEGDALHKKDGSPIETKGLSGLMGMRNGMAILYYNDGVLTQQGFKWSNRGLRESGRLRNVTKQLDKIEERLMEDIIPSPKELKFENELRMDSISSSKEIGIIPRKLRDKYKITLTGPTTLSALLNSLRMGFKTLLVQERSSEVWNILAAVKSEFATFGTQLSKVRTQLSTASSSLENLEGTRTRAMERKMRDIELIDSEQSSQILDLETHSKD